MNTNNKWIAIGMTAGILVSALIAVLVNVITGSSDIWNWATPVGMAVGLAIGSGLQQKHNAQNGD